MEIAQIKKESAEKTKYAFMTANLCNNAASEMHFLKPERYSGREGYILGCLTMRFYMVSLQYMFNAEYCKLFERDSVRKTQNVSSLIRLNNYHLDAIGEEFHANYLLNEEDINSILQSEFYMMQRELRDTKFSHSDVSDMNNFSISPFSEEELGIIFEHIKLVLRIINRCHIVFENEYFFFVPNVGTSTQHFITQQTEYQDYFFKNELGASDDML